MDEPLTKSLERYDVLDRIAVGGMAEVFLAKAYGAHGFEKTLAIKRILPELARDPEFEARFIAEAKVAVRLSHANVVQVLDFGRIGESLFIAMEYVDGLDLAAMLRKFKDEKRHVPLPAAFHIAIEIIRALDFAHGHNVVHRDVSPSNVLVSRAGEVKIADFGIAVAAQPHRNSTTTGPKRVMGKWRYMSPEQARGDTLDTRSDLFSAASVIYELFTGEKLFPGEEAEDIIKNIHTMPIPKMASLRPGLPSRLDEVLAGALARKPIDRPTRPATVLRSLIELSYESSIMATALDVAEALATVIPAKRATGSGALDDVIRKQLHEQSVARRTAITDGKPPSTETAERGQKGEVSTGLFRKIDVDGLPRLEEVDAATRVAAPRAKRNSSQGEVMPGDTDLHALYEAAHDRDRHTEVGGPPTGQVPKLGESAAALPKQPAGDKTASGKPRTLVWILVAIAVLALGGVGVWAMTRSPAAAVAVDAAAPPPPVVDAAPVDTRGTLTIKSTPPGIVTIAGVELGESPKSAKVTSGKAVKIKITRPSYVTLEDEVTLQPGENLTIEKSLQPAPAAVHVESVPPGVQVTYNGQIICEATPCEKALAPAKDAEFIGTKTGFDPARQKTTLVAGETAQVKLTLKEVPKFGKVIIHVTGVPIWGEVFHNGVGLGKTSGAGGDAIFTLPVGRQILLIRKGDKEGRVTVDVKENAIQTVGFHF